MTREKSSPEDIGVVANWEKREKGVRERVRESKGLRKRKVENKRH